ncbi:MAG: endonuclease/exonuclease/phosphatase family protein [Pseudomonadota bacterium]
MKPTSALLYASVAVVAGILGLGPLAFPQWGGLALLSFLSLHLSALVGAAAIVFLVLRQVPLTAALSVLAAILLMRPILTAGTASTVRIETATTLVWLNAQHKRGAVEQTLALAKDQQADIAAFAEMPVNWEQRFKTQLADYQCQEQRTDRNGERIVILSRQPCLDQGGHPVLGGRETVRWVDLGGGLRVVALHAPRPFHAENLAKWQQPWSQSDVLRRNTTIAEAGNLAADAREGIVIGDFNSEPWSPALKALRRVGFERVPCGAVWQPTWSTGTAVPGFAIDHAFVRTGRKASCSIGPDVGSDHLPLILHVERKSEDALVAEQR